MKRNILLIALITLSVLSCKKDKSKTYEIKIVANGSSYSVQAIENPSGKDYLNKQGQSGSNIYNFSYTEISGQNLNIKYTTSGNLNLKIYKDGSLSSDNNYPSGNGIINP